MRRREQRGKDAMVATMSSEALSVEKEVFTFRASRPKNSLVKKMLKLV